MIINNLASTLHLTNNINQSLKYYKKSLEYFDMAEEDEERSNGRKNKLVKEICLKIGEILKKQNKVSESVHYLYKWSKTSDN